MRICRFVFQGQPHWGRVVDLEGEAWIDLLVDAPEEDLGFQLRHGGRRPISTGFKPVKMAEATLLAPVVPGKILCVGRNYRDHVKELDHEMPTEPLIFSKPTTALVGSGAMVEMPKQSQRVDYEGELALVVGQRVRNLPAAEWRQAIRGAVLANDVTARDLQKVDGQWTRAKGFDTFCPVGPWVSDEVDLEANLTIETHVNGVRKQHGETKDFIFELPRLIEHITAFTTLEPGDLILTGTPAGVSGLTEGDVVEVSMVGLGVLRNEFGKAAASY